MLYPSKNRVECFNVICVIEHENDNLFDLWFIAERCSFSCTLSTSWRNAVHADILFEF